MQSFTREGRHDKIPLDTIKGFSKVNFKHESRSIPRPEGEGMCDLLGNDNVIRNSFAFNESLLRVVNVISEVGFKTIHKGFGDNFQDNIAQTNRSEVSRNF